MLNPRIRNALVAVAASAGLAACTNLGTYGGVGVGVGLGYGNDYGYGYGSPYYDNYYAGYPYYGWYDGFYYPGAGYWVYDPWGHPRPITERQKGYWANLLEKAREARGVNAPAKENWSAFSAKAATPTTVEQRRSLATIRQRIETQRAQDSAAQPRGADQRRVQVERQRELRSQQQQDRAERSQVRSERQDSIRQQVLERRQSRATRRSTDD